MLLKNWVKPGGLLSLLLIVGVTVGLFSLGITAEVPVGSVTGKVVMEGGQVGLPGADVILYRQTNDGWEGDSTWRAETDESGSFAIPSLPTGVYSANVFGKAHRVESVSVQVLEGQKLSVEWEAKRQPDYLGLNLGSRVFRPGEDITLRADGSTKGETLQLTVLKVDESSFDANRDLGDLLYGIATNRNRQSPTELAKLSEVQSEKTDLQTKDIEGVYVHEQNLKGLSYGIYLVKAQVEEQVDYAWLTVTDIALVTKTEPKKGEAFVVDIDSGQPLPDVSVSITRGASQVDLGKTNSNGLIGFDPMAGGERLTLVSAKRGDARAHSWFYKPSQEQDVLTSHFVTDRPIYRPGDLVQFKSVLRKGKPGAYTIPAGMAANVQVFNPNGDRITTFPAVVDDWGSISGEFRMNESDLQGTYSVEIEAGGQTEYGYVPLASYRKPQFEIDVSAEKSRVVRGDDLTFTIQCTSFTGEPIVGAKVQADLFSGYDYWSSPFDEEYYFEDDGSDYGLEFNRQFELVTDEQGRAQVTVNTGRVGGDGEYADFADTKFKLSASVSDEGGRFYSADGAAVASRGEYDLKAEFDRYVANPGQALKLEVNQPSDSSAALAGEATVEFGRELYSKEGWSFVAETKQKVRLNGVTTNVDLAPKKSGSYKAIITAVDRRGNEISTEAYVWVAGGDEYQGPSGLSVSLDSREYKVGEMAQVVVRSDKSDAAIWLTVEGEGILNSQVVRMDGPEAVVSIPVTDAFSPNFTVSVTQVAGKEFYQTQRGAKVGLANRELSVSITPDRNEMRPGETVNVLVSTKDQSGQPVQADVALRVVDEGIYQIREDQEDPIDSFYPRRWTVVSTNYSFPELYLDGEDKGGSNVAIRKDFADTAFWAASIKTGADGTATIPVKVPDNLTSWRVTGSAFDRETRVGKGISSVVSRKELMLRMSLPQFLTQDDEQEVAFMLTNATDAELTVAFELSVTGLELEGDSRGTIKVPARSREVVTRTVRALGMGEGVLKLVGRGGQFSDGLEQKVRIQPRVETRRLGQAGVLRSGDNFDAALEIDSKAITGDLRIEVAPNLFSAIEPTLDGLIDYPYGCVEQTMSRFVPSVLVRDYWRRTGQSRPEMDAKVDEVVQRGFARLRELQRGDGGFGWFAYDQSDPRMMALVLDGLYRVGQAGVTGGQPMIDRILPAAEDVLKTAKLENQWQRQEMVALAAAQSRYSASAGVRKALEAKYDDFDADSLAQLAIGCERIANTGGADSAKWKQRARTVWAALKKKLTITTSEATVGDALGDSWALEASLLFEPELATKIVRQLMKVRTSQGWGDTWRTSQAIKAAMAYIDRMGVQSAQGTVTVSLNGRILETVDFAANGAKTNVISVPLKELRSGANEVRLQFVGEGEGQYAIDLSQGVYAQASQPVASPPGFRIKREYLPMAATRLEDGSLRLLPGKRASEQFKSGEVFRCRLTITVDNALEYVAIEDPIPSNCRIVDADSPEPGYDWTNWWSNSTFGDDKAAFFIHRLGRGEHVIEYAIRAEAPGVANALPTTAYPMYLRGVEAGSAQSKAEVRQ